MSVRPRSRRACPGLLFERMAKSPTLRALPRREPAERTPAIGRCRGDERARRADQAVAVSRSKRRLSRPVRRGARAIYRRYVTLAKEHWGADAHGLERVRSSRAGTSTSGVAMSGRADGTFPTMQVRERELASSTPLDAFLARTDGAAHEYLTECLAIEREIDAGRSAATQAPSRIPSASKPKASEASSARLHDRAALQPLELLERLRPVVLQQPREPAIGQQLAAGLAGRAVVGFVDGVHDRAGSACRTPGTASRTGRAPPSRREMPSPSRESVAGFGDQRVAPLRQTPCTAPSAAARSRPRPRRLVSCIGDSRRGVQNLVGVRVADAAEEMRIGQRALERVVLPPQRLANSSAVDVKHLEAAGIECGQRLLAPNQIQRGAPLRARLGQQQRAVGKSNAARPTLPGTFAPPPPAEAAGDHQVDDQEQIVLESPAPSACPGAGARSRACRRGLDRRIDRADAGTGWRGECARSRWPSMRGRSACR